MTIFGTKNNDKLLGSTSNDIFVSFAGNDLVVGDAGNDILVGSNQFSRGKGEFDVLVGGSNNDAFVLGDRSGSYYGFGVSAQNFGVEIYSDCQPTKWVRRRLLSNNVTQTWNITKNHLKSFDCRQQKGVVYF
jgi:hypothetical protein